MASKRRKVGQDLWQEDRGPATRVGDLFSKRQPSSYRAVAGIVLARFREELAKGLADQRLRMSRSSRTSSSAADADAPRQRRS
jgi:hypothetical protein